MTDRSEDRLPDGYRLLRERDLVGGDGPYPQLVWLWVHYQGGWSTTGSGVLIADDVILTCAHIFAFGGATYDRVIAVSAFPGYNQRLRSDQEPPGRHYVETVYICGRAFPDVRNQENVDSAWDLAVVCLSNPVPPRQAPPFVVSVEDHLAIDPAFQDLKDHRSELMTAGYGGPGGLIVQAYMPIAEAYESLHWMGVELTPSPGQSGAPMFHTGFGPDPDNQPEFRLVGVVSAEDRTKPGRTIGAMMTERTATWINSALETHEKVKKFHKPGEQASELLVRLHHPQD
jgi:hypothetical protein